MNIREAAAKFKTDEDCLTYLEPFFLYVANIRSSRVEVYARILMFLAVIFLAGVAVGRAFTAWAMGRKRKP